MLTHRYIAREIRDLSKPDATGTLAQLRHRRHRVDGYCRAVMAYGDLDAASLLRLRRDAYVAEALGADHLRSLSSEDIEDPPNGASSASEAIELFGSLEAAEQAVRDGAEGRDRVDTFDAIPPTLDERDSLSTPEGRAWDYLYLLGKTRAVVKGGRTAWEVQSPNERMAVALALNRFDLLAAMDITMCDAIARVEPTWLALIPSIAKVIEEDSLKAFAALLRS